jgi:hypothetical protein
VGWHVLLVGRLLDSDAVVTCEPHHMQRIRACLAGGGG